MTLRLLDLAHEHAVLLDALEHETAETGELPQEFEVALAALEGAIDRKVEGCARVISALAAEATALHDEEERLAARGRTRMRAIERLRDYVRGCLVRAGIPRVKTATHTVYTTRPKPRAEVLNPAELPREFVRVTVEPNKRAILEALVEGLEVPGARLVEGEAGLVIR